MQRSKTLWVWIALLLVFTLIGPVLGGLIFWVGSGVVFGAVKSVSDLGKLATGALAVSIAMTPLAWFRRLLPGLSVAWFHVERPPPPSGWPSAQSSAGLLRLSLCPRPCWCTLRHAMRALPMPWPLAQPVCLSAALAQPCSAPACVCAFDRAASWPISRPDEPFASTASRRSGRAFPRLRSRRSFHGSVASG